MKRPSFQFYPADWRNNANLRRCSWEARGVWVEVMGLLHDSDQYGLLRWPLKEIAQALGAPVKLVLELATKGVMKGADSGPCDPFVYTPRSGRRDGQPVTLVPTSVGPLWYSSRMVRDEYVRTIRGADTRFGEGHGEAPKHAPKPSPKPPKGDGSTSSSTSTPTGNTPQPPRGGAALFDAFWSAYPSKVGKDAAKRAFAKRKPTPELLAEMLGSLKVQRDSEKWKRDGGQYIPNPSTWLNQGRWQDGELATAADWQATRSGIESRGIELGLGAWGETEQFGAYKARVMAAHQQGAH